MSEQLKTTKKELDQKVDESGKGNSAQLPVDVKASVEIMEMQDIALEVELTLETVTRQIELIRSGKVTYHGFPRLKRAQAQLSSIVKMLINVKSGAEVRTNRITSTGNAKADAKRLFTPASMKKPIQWKESDSTILASSADNLDEGYEPEIVEQQPYNPSINNPKGSNPFKK
ncbi:MAG: hypothetical protein HC874_14305 [Richelia sp. SL_2_1]|nr:hypothetical protein [Richelia sp. SL_2_1]